MDTILANAQAKLAYQQRDLATQTKLQLPQNLNINAMEQKQMDETEDLNRLTRNNQFEVEKQRRESSTGAVDHISQLQKCQVQLQIAERQLQVAERQLQIATAHVQNAMDPMLYSSQLSQQSDIRKAEDFRKKAVPLFSEATELLKQARHSVAFKEMGARQRMGGLRSDSFRKNQAPLPPYPNPKPGPPPPYDGGFDNYALSEGPMLPPSAPPPHSLEGFEITPPMSVIGHQPASPPPTSPVMATSFQHSGAHPNGSTPPPMPPGVMMGTTKSSPIQLPKQKPKRGCCTPCVFFLCILVLLILAAGGFCVYWFLFREEDD